MPLRPNNVRHRVTLWFVGVMALVLLLFICGATLLQFWQLTNQLYHAEIQDIETAEGLLYFTADGRLLLHEEYHNHPQDRLLLDRLMEVLTPQGQVLFRNEKLGGRDLGGAPFPREGVSGYGERSVRLEDGTRVLLISHVHSINGKPLLIRLAYSMAPLTDRLLELIGLLLLALPLTLTFAGFAGYRMVRRILQPLEDMAGRTEQITASRLNERLPVENPGDELGHMARVLNGLLERLQASFEHLKQFTADASHELRTPLASMRSVGEVGLQRDHTSEEYRDIIGSMLEEVTRLTGMVNALLAMAQADSGQVRLHKSTFSPVDAMNETIGIVGVLAEDKRQNIHFQGETRVLVEADRTILERAFVNIIENAIKHAPVGSNLHVTVREEVQGEGENNGRRRVELAIEDEGPGIPEALRSRVFERFFRVDEARSRDAGGAGLGLAIAKWAVEVNGGSLELRAGRTGGCLFSILLPTVRLDER